MRDDTEAAQEPKNETVTAAVSDADKWRVKLVAKRTKKSVSDLLWEHSVTDLVAWGRRIEEAIEEVPSPATETAS